MNNPIGVFLFHILYKGYNLFPCNLGMVILEYIDHLDQTMILVWMQQKLPSYINYQELALTIIFKLLKKTTRLYK